ncbi:OmpA/MotB domain protein [Rubellimicrobium mesophilum DSM 19309]|uniref:OmpA/MotB domain protein n=1 Tax=Rubellimicrobium mesophilum DSM 19309 TaxID=442562 RepID=A0A017HNA9_9RHOB|nr:OmpA family protein [Rubellimicrobium mesophilum]EYD75861.1 OmpA/MotB domain protein [Rubellimicrobium mesophilum DSM 19309]
MSNWLPASMALMLSGASGVHAQATSDDQLAQTFQAQHEAIRAAQDEYLYGSPRGGPDNGLDRGIEVVAIESLDGRPTAPLDEGEAVAQGPDAERPAEEAEAAQPAIGDVVYVIPPESALQINVHVEFPFDSAALTEDQIPKLQQLCRVMGREEFNGSRSRIIGHTDAKGEDAYNDRLSLLRAQEVVRYFVNTCGLDTALFEAMGLGEHQLLDPADPEAAANRRVEFQLEALS